MKNDQNFIVLKKEGSQEYRYREADVLGHGQFGRVFQGYDSNNLVFAIKTIDLKEVQRKHNVGSLVYMRREVELMEEISKFSHENTVNLLASFESKDSVLYLVMECCKTDLSKFIASKRPALGLPEDLCRYYLLQLVTGLKFLNDNNVLHRDLKPPNILLLEDSDRSTIKISDFGLSKKIVDMTSSQVGSPLYMAPEVVSGLPYTFKYDVWSTGCIFFEMLTGKSPYDSYKLTDIRQLPRYQRTQSPSQILEKLNSFAPYKDNKIVISDFALELLGGFLNYDPKKRWNWNDILSSHYFRDDLMKISTINFPKMELQPQTGKKPVEIVIGENVAKIDKKFRQRRVTCFLFYPHGSERNIVFHAGKVYTIKAVKESTKCDNCQIFDRDGVLFSDEMILFNVDCENPDGLEIKDLFFVDFKASLLPPIPFLYPQGDNRGALPLLKDIVDSHKDIARENGRERITALCDMSRERLYNVFLVSQNMQLILRQFYNTDYQIKIQEKILTVVQVYISSELRRQKELVLKYIKEFETLSSQVTAKKDILSLAINLTEPSEFYSNLNSHYDIVEYSQPLKTKLEDLLSQISLLLLDKESPLKQTFIMNYEFNKSHIEPVKATIEVLENTNKPKFQNALVEATLAFHYDYETGYPPKFTLPANFSLTSNADELNEALSKNIPLYDEILKTYVDLLAKRAIVEAEKDTSSKKCFARLLSFNEIFAKVQETTLSLESYKQALILFESSIKKLLSIKVAINEFSRRNQALSPLGQALEYCDTMAQKEVLNRDTFQTINNSPILAQNFPGLLPITKQTNEVVSNGVEKKAVIDTAPKILDHCYDSVKDCYTNGEVQEALLIKNITQNNEILNKRKDEADAANLDVQFAQNVRGENGRKKSISEEKILLAIADEKEKVAAFINKNAELNETLSEQEKQIRIHHDFFASLVGEDLLAQFRKICEVREGTQSIREQFESGPYSDPHLQYQLWTLKSLVSIVLSTSIKTSSTQVTLEMAKEVLLDAKPNWDRAVSFAEFDQSL